MKLARDVDFLHEVLLDGQEHSLVEINKRSIEERGFQLTVHSRAPELRRKLLSAGLTVINRTERTAGGRVASYYRLAPLPDASPSTHSGGASGSEGPSLAPTPPEAAVKSTGTAAAAASHSSNEGGGSTLFEVPARPAWA